MKRHVRLAAFIAVIAAASFLVVKGLARNSGCTPADGCGGDGKAASPCCAGDKAPAAKAPAEKPSAPKAPSAKGK